MIFLTWQDIEESVDSLVSRLPRNFDLLLVITRGGMVPACLISERMDLRNIVAAAVMFYTGVRETMDAPIFLEFPADPLLLGKRVLVVDDVWETGRTIDAVRRKVESAGGKPTVAVLDYKPSRSKVASTPDYYAKMTDEWIVYPWDPDRERLLVEHE